LFFANAEDFRVRVLAAVDDRRQRGFGVRRVLLNCEAMVDADATAIEAMRSLILELKDDGIVVSLARVHVELAELLRRSGLLPLVGPANVYPTLPTAVAGYEAEQEATRPPDD
jgi:SulP family sulfate permease